MALGRSGTPPSSSLVHCRFSLKIQSCCCPCFFLYTTEGVCMRMKHVAGCPHHAATLFCCVSPPRLRLGNFFLPLRPFNYLKCVFSQKDHLFHRIHNPAQLAVLLPPPRPPPTSSSTRGRWPPSSAAGPSTLTAHATTPPPSRWVTPLCLTTHPFQSPSKTN